MVFLFEVYNVWLSSLTTILQYFLHIYWLKVRVCVCVFVNM